MLMWLGLHDSRAQDLTESSRHGTRSGRAVPGRTTRFLPPPARELRT